MCLDIIIHTIFSQSNWVIYIYTNIYNIAALPCTDGLQGNTDEEACYTRVYQLTLNKHYGTSCTLLVFVLQQTTQKTRD